MTTNIVALSSPKAVEPGDLCDTATRANFSIEWSEGDSDAKLYSWEHERLPVRSDRNVLYRGAEDAAAAALKALAEYCAQELGMVVVPKAPPSCLCCSGELSTNHIGKAVRAAHNAARGMRVESDGVEVGRVILEAAIMHMLDLLNYRCLRCAITSISDAGLDGGLGADMLKAAKAAMLGAL